MQQADKFAAIVSAIGENKLNPISKQNDGNGPYKRGFVLGFGPSQDDTQTNPVWAFGIKGKVVSIQNYLMFAPKVVLNWLHGLIWQLLTTEK